MVDLRRFWTFLGALSVVLTIITGSVAVVGYLANPARRVETVLEHSVIGVGWIAIIVILVYFVYSIRAVTFREWPLSVAAIPLAVGFFVAAHFLTGGLSLDWDARRGNSWKMWRSFEVWRWFAGEKFDFDASKALDETVGWITVGYVAFLVFSALVFVVVTLTRTDACPSCRGRLPSKANFCPSCGEVLPADDAARASSRTHADS
ncbi:MAG TPA: zinc ribbon domain-containing protein [Solirubrobacteraceae bacterium]|jgi:hypothetical protein|nr:zinc ribbon domain-containing protein [Solirubrobacteraceae bacterium]